MTEICPKIRYFDKFILFTKVVDKFVGKLLKICQKPCYGSFSKFCAIIILYNYLYIYQWFMSFL